MCNMLICLCKQSSRIARIYENLDGRATEKEYEGQCKEDKRPWQQQEEEQK